MITREQVPTVLDHPVYDTDDNKIGDARHVFLDDVTGRPEWVSLKTGLFGTRESFVPITHAGMVEDHLKVPALPVRALRLRLGCRPAAGKWAQWVKAA